MFSLKLVIAAVGSAAAGSLLGGIAASSVFAGINSGGWPPEQSLPVILAGLLLGLVGFVLALLPAILLGIPFLWALREHLHLPAVVTAAVLGCAGGVLGLILWQHNGPLHFSNPDVAGPVAIGALVGLFLGLLGSRTLAAV